MDLTMLTSIKNMYQIYQTTRIAYSSILSLPPHFGKLIKSLADNIERVTNYFSEQNQTQ